MNNMSSLPSEEHAPFLKKYLPLEIGIAVAVLAVIIAVAISFFDRRENLPDFFPADSVICGNVNIDRIRSNPAAVQLLSDAEKRLYQGMGLNSKKAKFWQHIISYYWIKNEDISQIAWSMNAKEEYFFCGNVSSQLTEKLQKLAKDVLFFFGCMKKKDIRKLDNHTYSLKNDCIISLPTSNVVTVFPDIERWKQHMQRAEKHAPEALALNKEFLKAKPVFWIVGKIPPAWHPEEPGRDVMPAAFAVAGYYTGKDCSQIQLEARVFCTDELQSVNMQMKVMNEIYQALCEAPGKAKETKAFLAQNLHSQKNGTVLTYSLVIPADYLISTCRKEFDIKKYGTKR